MRSIRLRPLIDLWRRRDEDCVSRGWIAELERREMRETWQGPRWRSPREIEAMRRREAWEQRQAARRRA